MAKSGTCEYCGKIGPVEMRFGINYCTECTDAIRKTDYEYFNRIGDARATLRAKKEIRSIINSSEDTEQRKAEAEQIEINKRTMIVSSCSSIDGYRATKQFGMVFGECVFKSGFFKRLGASIENIADMVSFGDKELGGSTQLMDSARNYAMAKMINTAAEKGANAVIGVDAESSIGGELIHVMIYGTAVRIEPITKE